ncbi:hypothetical protein AAC387_Pa03g2740 [Persea americana]
MFMVRNTVPSKHGMKGPRWMQNRIAKFEPKLLPIIGAQDRNFNGSIESAHQSSYDSKDPNIERSSISQFDGLDPRVHEPNRAQNMSPNEFRKANNHAAGPSTSGGGPQPHLVDAQYCLKEK